MQKRKDDIDMARKQFAIWQVGDEEYKLKLKTSTLCDLEEKLGTSLMNVLGNGNMPALKIMLTITHYAMKDYNANIKFKDVQDIFDKYVDEGGSQLEFFTKVIMDIYKVSGFFTESQTEMMEEKQEEMKEMLA
ncbi:MAG: DUF6096 family protein [Clostridium paraputrificum]|uniref:DUF6096 family protein n=1 Tax=Clostridium sp. TaxID=1506 RepID=UPI00204BCA61|nr:DUF6096 family protein [Clostridium sp.]MDU4320125.1 DUF6096 family protein [Clostridium sp.]DAU71205.1 MAG TPA: tail assembly chaperone [Caudoviricetes sp.]